MFDLSQSPPEQIRILENHLKALRDYQPAPCSLPIALFRASDQLLSHLALDPTLGWSALAGTNISVRVVPGSHGSMTTEPLVRDLAGALSEELDLAQRVLQ
jgi:thioesterase domain-containing protein